MKATARRNRILKILRSERSVTTAALRTALSVSAETVRQDLIQLVAEGLVHRDHGVVTLAGADTIRPALRRRGMLNADERREEIQTLVEQRTSVRTRELARVFGVSPATIRNDVLQLERQGVVSRRHGEIVRRPAVPSEIHGRQIHGMKREAEESTAGRSACLIAGHLLQTVDAGDALYLDDSEVSLEVASGIDAALEVTVFTNSLRVASTCARRARPVEVFVLPGYLTHDGIETDVQFRAAVAASLRFSKAFLSLRSIAADGTFYVYRKAHAELFRFVVKLSDSTYFHLCGQEMGEPGPLRLSLGRDRRSVRQIIPDSPENAAELESVLSERWPAVICAAGRDESPPLPKTVGFAMMDGRRFFSRCVRDTLASEMQATQEAQLLIYDNEFDTERTLANVDELIECGVDLVIEYQHDYALSGLIGEKFADTRIPVIAVDIPVAGAVFFGIKNYQAGSIAGAKAAREVSANWGNRIDAMLIVGDSATGPTSEGRVRGMVDVFRRSIDVDEGRIVRVDPTNTHEGVCSRVMDAWRDGSIPPDASRILILTVNATATLGTVSAVDAMGVRESVMIVGHNVTPQVEIELARRDTPLIGSVDFHPEWYGRGIMRIAREILAGRTVEPNNHVEPAWTPRTHDYAAASV